MKKCVVITIAMILIVLAASALADRVVIDAAGREVAIPDVVERVACQSSTCEAIIISLGKAKMLAGTTDYTNQDSLAFRLFPDLREVTALADDMSVEEMLQNNVQVVFVKDLNKIAKYESAGLPVIYIELDSVEGTKAGIRIVGDVIGASEPAEKCVSYIENTETFVRERIETANTLEFSAYYARAKYSESNLMTTYAANHIYAEWIALINGTVITKGMELAETKGGVTLNAEELLIADPDVIFVGGYYRMSVYEEAMNGDYRDTLGAIKNGKVFMVPTSVSDWSVGGCELGLTMLWCAKQVYPDLFSDVDMVQEIMSFYSGIANVEIDHTLAEDILFSNGN